MLPPIIYDFEVRDFHKIISGESVEGMKLLKHVLSKPEAVTPAFKCIAAMHKLAEMEREKVIDSVDTPVGRCPSWETIKLATKPSSVEGFKKTVFKMFGYFEVAMINFIYMLIQAGLMNFDREGSSKDKVRLLAHQGKENEDVKFYFNMRLPDGMPFERIRIQQEKIAEGEQVSMFKIEEKQTKSVVDFEL